ncbi:MAG: hypothetical protein WKG01_00360 [Kofleriaceae bacterium]
MLTTATLHVHAWLRWLLLVLALVVLVRAVHGWRRGRSWAPLDDRLARVFIGLADLQMLAGLVMMLWTSPLVAAAWQAGLSAMLEQPALLVFGLVHPLGMFVAIAVIHAAHGRAERIADVRIRHRTIAIGVGAWFVIVLALIPWPFVPWGRPLARIGLPGAGAPASPRAPRSAADLPRALRVLSRQRRRWRWPRECRARPAPARVRRSGVAARHLGHADAFSDHLRRCVDRPRCCDARTW